MSTYTSVRAMVRTDVADAARSRAETEGKTLAEAVAALLTDYASEKTTRPRKRAAAS
jgi:hypothetical protein